MSRFLALWGSELRGWARRPGLHIFAAMYLALGVLTVGSIAGYVEFISLGGYGGQVKADSPHSIVGLTMVFGLFALLNFTAAAGGAATRDVTDGMHALVHATPVPKVVLLGSRFLGALTANAYVIGAAFSGLLLGFALPWLEPERIGAFDLVGTVLCALAWVGPNLIFVTGLFFGIGSVTRRMFPIYIGGVLLFVGYSASSAFTSDLDDRTLAAMMDPFGLAALEELTRYWTPAEQNSLWPVPTGVALANRLFWTAIGAVGLAGGAWLTRLDEAGWQPFARWQRVSREVSEASPSASVALPVVARRFDAGGRAAQAARLTRLALRDVVGHRYFWAFVACAVLFQLLNANNMGQMYGTNSWPVTYQVIEMLEGTLGLFTLIILTFYAGDLVWVERDQGSAQLVDASPVPDGLPILAKAVALFAVLAALHTTIVMIGPSVQLLKGFTAIDLGLYVQWIYGFSLIDWVPWVALALALHVVLNHKVAGHAATIGVMVLGLFRQAWGFELNLPWWGSDPGRTYSDMNGWGFSGGPYLLYKAYWAAFAGVLLVVARLAWVRGLDTAVAVRWREARRRLDRSTGAAFAACLTAFVGLGALLGYQAVVVAEYEHSVVRKRLQARYELEIKPVWEAAPHPEFTDVRLEVDLYPDEGRARVRGRLALVNPHDVPIERMLVSYSDDGMKKIEFEPGFTDAWDEEMELHVWTLARPLPPGGAAVMTYELEHVSPGIPNSGFETDVVSNGTFLNSASVIPTLGYLRDGELSDPADRRKYELPERDRMFDLDDPRARRHNYITDDAHRVPFEVRLSTVASQIPLAPGDIVAEGAEGGRRWRTFRANRPIHHFFAFLSAEWEVRRREDGVVPVEVYFHPAHPYNVDRMLDATVKSLAVFERDFSPFQHDVLRIVEFPRYASFAQSFPTLIPFSESIGFIARIADPEHDIDYPFYVTAHEVAHQWFAHQVIAGNGQGATVLSESLSQYGALKVMEAEYGRDHIRRFLKYEADRYFSSRAFERDEELPLMRVENQGYIHYQKGGHVLYALSERVGRERFDAAIRGFLDRWAFVGPPYPTARDFVEHLERELPEHLPAIDAAFRRIVVYDLRAERATATPAGDRWVVEVSTVAHARVVDGQGLEAEEIFDDDVEVKLTFDAGEPQTLIARVTTGQPTRLEVDRRPLSVELDPRALLLERDRQDQSVDVD